MSQTALPYQLRQRRHCSKLQQLLRAIISACKKNPSAAYHAVHRPCRSRSSQGILFPCRARNVNRAFQCLVCPVISFLPRHAFTATFLQALCGPLEWITPPDFRLFHVAPGVHRKIARFRCASVPAASIMVPPNTDINRPSFSRRLNNISSPRHSTQTHHPSAF